MAGLSQSSVDYVVRQAMVEMAATREPELSKEEFCRLVGNNKITRRFKELYLKGDMVYGVCKCSGNHIRVKRIKDDKVVDLLKRKGVI